MRLGLFLIVLGLFVAVAPRAPWPDEIAAQASTARSLVARGSLDIAADGANAASHVHAGRRYADAPPGLALWLVPVEALAKLGVSPRLRQLGESATSALAVALLCALFAAELRRRGARASTTAAATLALAFATGVCASARLPDGAALSSLLLYAALVYGRRDGARAALSSGLYLGALVLVEPSLGAAAWVLAVAASLQRRSSVSALAQLGPLAVGSALVLVYRAHTGWFPPPHGDWLQGLDGLLLSTGKSVLLYSPPLVLAWWALPAWWRTRRTEAMLGLAVVAATVVVVAGLDRWDGDPAWGPRRIAPILPILAEPIALWLDGARTRAQRVLVALVLAAGLVVQALGAALSPSSFPRVVSAVRSTTGAGSWFVDPPSELHFIPQFSPLQGHAWLLWHLAYPHPTVGHEPWHLLLPNAPPVDRELAKVSIDWWVLGAPRPLVAGGLVVCALLVGAGVLVLTRRLRRIG